MLYKILYLPTGEELYISNNYNTIHSFPIVVEVERHGFGLAAPHSLIENHSLWKNMVVALFNNKEIIPTWINDLVTRSSCIDEGLNLRYEHFEIVEV
jgi:hypothetical protein